MLPVRMLNEYVYCPRLFALEHVHGQWADSSDTVEGRTVHRRVDRPDDGELDPQAPVSRRSVDLSDEELGLVAKIDLVELDDGAVVPVDYKRGRPAPNEHGAWDPERVQVCAQALLLRAHGYTCDHGVLYFVKARRRVKIPLTDELVALTLRATDDARAQAQRPSLPEPLQDSPKCPRCSLVGICLPDEHHALRSGHPVRPLLPARDDALPMYVQRHRGKVGKRGGEIVVSEDRKVVQKVPLEQVSQLIIQGNAQVSTQLLGELARRDVPVAYHGYSGWYRGTFRSSSGTNVFLRIQQHRASDDPPTALALARAFVDAKTHNQRVYLRRNGRELGPQVLQRMAEIRKGLSKMVDLDELRGKEGAVAQLYFQSWTGLVRGELGEGFRWERRSRRPAMDPVNSMLNFLYACLVREITQVLHRIGFDPFVGFLHAPRYNRPALSLDMMEEFRPLIVDSSVVSAINNSVLRHEDFLVRRTGTTMTKTGRAKLLKVYERRLDELVTHPVFGHRLSYRRVLEVQARMLGKVLQGEIAVYPGFKVR